MTPLEREELKRRAQAKLAAMRAHAARLRKRVLAGAAIGFAILWAAIFAQMMVGQDPALGPATANVRSAAQEGVAADPERRALRASAAPAENDEEGLADEERLAEANRREEERVAAAEAEQLEEEVAAEAAELETVTTGQS